MSLPTPDVAPVSPPNPLRLLVFAGVPPPVHGQNVMVAALLAGLRQNPAFSVVHIDPRLSSTTSEVGRGGIAKFFRLLAACARAWQARAVGGPMAFYYVPAPGRKVPVFRDWIVMLLCRPFFTSLILHWHAVGLGAWTASQANRLERWFTRSALDRADLAIVLAPELQADAAIFRPRRVVIIPNGVEDPASPAEIQLNLLIPLFEVLFLGLGSEEKGLFATLDGVRLANAREPGKYRLTFAGGFASAEDERRFSGKMRASPTTIRRVGLVTGLAKTTLLRQSHVLCFPTQYPHEGQPLVLIEALAFNLPIVTTRWRAIPGMLPPKDVWFVDPERPSTIADALQQARQNPPTSGSLRNHFLDTFTLDRHLAAMKNALLSVAPDDASK
jgi:glycosyltransferase involved in cell wall biosynthesis